MTLGVLWLAAVALTAGVPVSRSTRDGVYSAAQAERGEKTYKAKCGTCHMPEQYSGYVFMQSWTGQTIFALYTNLRTTMPKDNPGSLKPQEYADVIAYLLKINRLPTGDTDLKGAKPAMEDVVIEGPEK
ncbi:MAG TPA: cytochrome c [Vicinamibacterales bacterium]|jgi:mono/diheme cytochrome c family protein|nr:cytochrome c [Vicinamibacterales bacterium]